MYSVFCVFFRDAVEKALLCTRILCYTYPMLPVYCLSIMLNTLAGLILVFGAEAAEPGSLPFSFNNKTLRLVSGVWAVVTAVLKILSPVAGNVPVVGDLVPALTGLGAGLVLIIEFANTRLPDSRIADYLERIAALLGRNRKMCGIGAIGAAALHLVFYPIIFL